MNKTDKKKPIVIEDVHVEWHGEDGLLHFFVEFEDGTEKELLNIEPETVPTFATAPADAPIDATDYGEWYDEALQVAHGRGYILAGEAENEGDED